MYILTNFIKVLSVRNVFKKLPGTPSSLNRPIRRYYGDSSKVNSTSKQVVAQGTESEERVRVRRARVSDGPRVLRYVRDNARAACPPLAAHSARPPPPCSHLILNDYVQRALAQGHSMLAEQLESRRGWSQVRGLALGMAVCPWDAAMLERWARCVRCTRSRRLVRFTAYCLRAPALHDKYSVHNILQVILIVPPDTPKSSEIVQMLAKNAIQRGRDVGFPLIRFDAFTDPVIKSLEGLKLKKEWQFTYELPSKIIKDTEFPSKTEAGGIVTNIHNSNKESSGNKNFIAVYTLHTDTKKV